MRKSKIVLVLIALVVLAVLAAAPACMPRASLPLRDVQALNALGTAEIPKFVEHYSQLYAQQRAPTSEEYGYWTAKYEMLHRLYLYFKGEIAISELGNETLSNLLGNSWIASILKALLL